MGPTIGGQGAGSGIMLGPGWMWGLGMGIGGVVMLVFWGALLVGLVLLVRAVGGGRSEQSLPLDVLKRRYAAGQITREEFEEIRKDLER